MGKKTMLRRIFILSELDKSDSQRGSAREDLVVCWNTDLKSFEYSMTLSPSLIQMLPPCLKVCFKSSGSSSGSNSSPTFSSKTWWMNDEWWCSLRKQPIFWDALVSPSEDQARKFHTDDVLIQTLAVLPIGWKFASANQNTQIWVVKRQQYGISARVPQASPLGNHWWARKTWWCRLFSQTMINVFFSKWIIRYSNRLNFEESRLKSRSYSWAKAERNKWAFRETLKTKRKQSFV